jgi:hypothetical protein
MSSSSSLEDEDLELAEKPKKKKPKVVKKRKMNDEFEYEYQLADVAQELNLFTKKGMIAELTPLLIAIQYRHIDVVRFILEKMKIDKHMALSLVTKQDDKHHSHSKKNEENLLLSMEPSIDQLSN